MELETKKARAIRELKKALASMATFARIREELFLLRVTTPEGQRRERLEQMIRLNQETMDATKKILVRAEDAFQREIDIAS
jgi:hypothetical protein